VVRYIGGKNTLVDELEGNPHVDSDYEGDTTGAYDETLKEEKEESRAVLIAGSFSAYVYFLAWTPRREK